MDKSFSVSHYSKHHSIYPLNSSASIKLRDLYVLFYSILSKNCQMFNTKIDELFNSGFIIN